MDDRCWNGRCFLDGGRGNSLRNSCYVLVVTGTIAISYLAMINALNNLGRGNPWPSQRKQNKKIAFFHKVGEYYLGNVPSI